MEQENKKVVTVFLTRYHSTFSDFIYYAAGRGYIDSERKTKIVIAKFIHSFVSNCKNIDFKEAVRSREILQAGL